MFTNISGKAVLVSIALASSCIAADRPNIIYILADDMGPGDVAAYNKDSKIPTPHLDRMAKEGMMFMDSHTGSGVCTPTRYGIITGRYAWRTRLKSQVLQGFSPHLIEPGRETAASLLKKQGYNTACFGKWHMGMDWQSTDGNELKSSKPVNVDLSAPIQNGPLDVGFDYYFGISASLNMDPHAYIENRMFQGTPEYVKDLKGMDALGYIQPAKPGWIAKEFKQDQVLPDIAKKTCEWIREQAGNPFFIYMPLNSPHSPIVPSSLFKDKSGLNVHGDFCMETDWAVGEVLKTLDELGIADNTLVIFTADNGTSPKAGFPEMAKKGHHSSWIYRGMKGTNWEGGHRTPFIARWPDEVKAGSRSDQLICTADFLATCAEIGGAKLGDEAGEDSVSFFPALKGEQIPGGKNRLVIHHSDKGVFSIRSGKWKVMFDDFGGSGRGDPRKDEAIINAASLQLFDMDTDAVENVNLAAAHPEVVEQLKMKLAGVIKNGRSTSGAAQPYKMIGRKGEEWSQLSVVQEYLD
ncbi:sulfatase family protein [Pontiella sulfatireligans]|uniref:Arylsulfatase n=1 Tax=Pontiella sulfatireligans TaxID=2750658 RepID=A0A6C2UFP6_9BACT|nr:arylsulfatase [Pontiella sulfatireligans]SPS74268.1 sulfatase S1_15 [Kiritimatiellales bacterium]VGO18928.1 Arylsulfatase [Pontiella sulfatireligans]